MLYFAVGATMDPELLGIRDIPFTSRIPARLQNHKLVFDKPSALFPQLGRANVRKARGEQVYGVLYEIDDIYLEALEKMEGGARYSFIDTISVETVDKVSHEAKIHGAYASTELKPSTAYLNHMLQGARGFLPDDYVEMLTQIQTAHLEGVFTMRKEAI